MEYPIERNAAYTESAFEAMVKSFNDAIGLWNVEENQKVHQREEINWWLRSEVML